MILLTLQRSEKQVIVIVTVSNIILILVTYTCNERVHIIGIKHGFSCINVCQVPREVLKTEAEGPEGGVENRGPRPRFSTPPSGPGKR